MHLLDHLRSLVGIHVISSGAANEFSSRGLHCELQMKQGKQSTLLIDLLTLVSCQ